jgi:hypothetical protein
LTTRRPVGSRLAIVISKAHELARRCGNAHVPRRRWSDTRCAEQTSRREALHHLGEPLHLGAAIVDDDDLQSIEVALRG